jgi:hypothetical protein
LIPTVERLHRKCFVQFPQTDVIDLQSFGFSSGAQPATATPR